MTQKSILDRIRDSVETTGAGLEEQVKRQYSHECGHMGVPAGDGLLTGDGVAMADQILRETMAFDDWRTMDAAARCEAVKRAFYLAWRRALGLSGEPDSRPFGPRCCGFARAMGELIPGFPAEDSANHEDEFNIKGIAVEVAEATRRTANNKEAVLDQPYHLFFFSAVDGDGRTRFFDIMKEGQEFSLAETATSAPRLGRCVETAYQNATGVRHHVHRNYGQVRTETAREAMEQIAKQTLLTQVTQLAETLTHREALPVWKVIFEKLGCESAAFSLESVTDYRKETIQGTSNAGQNRRSPAGKSGESVTMTGAAENQSGIPPQNPTRLRLFDEPSPIALNTIILRPATALLVAGIVNPAGPTLNVVMAHGLWRPGATLSIVKLMLNPVSQEVQTVGEIFVAETWHPSAIISHLFRLPFGSCPSLLLPSVFLDKDAAVSLHAKFLKGFADARRVLEDVKAYSGNPWDRVSMELDRSFANMNKPRSPKEPLNESEAMELSALLLSERHSVPELQAFMYAWKGSIEHFALGLATLELDDFVKVFAHLTVHCRLPEQKSA